MTTEEFILKFSQMLTEYEKEIRADERRKFAEWLVDCLDCNKTFMNAFIKKYEKEKQNDNRRND